MAAGPARPEGRRLVRSTAKPAPRPARRPKLRCPACGGEVFLPARACSHCRADLQTGYLHKKRSRLSLKQGLTRISWLIILTGAVCLLVKTSPRLAGDLAATAPSAGPAEGLTAEEKRAGLAAAPIRFQQLADQNPFLLLPYIYVYRAKTSAQGHQNQFEARYRQIEDLAAISQNLAAYQKASPAQRQQMLEELMALGETPASGGRAGKTSPHD